MAEHQEQYVNRSLINGEERSKQSANFHIPTREEREAIRVGAYVKIGWEVPDGPGERMWVKVTEAKDGRYKGLISNHPVVFTDLEYDQEVSFGPEHILTTMEMN